MVDGIVEDFDDNILLDGFAFYDTLARSKAAGTPPPFGEKAIELLDEVRQM